MHKMSYHLDGASELFSELRQEGFWHITSPLSGIMQKKNFPFFWFQPSILYDVSYFIPDRSVDLISHFREA